LQLTSQPVTAFGAESSLQILDWSSLISGPKVFLADAPKPADTGVSFAEATTPAVPEPPPVDRSLLAARMLLTRDIGRTRFRRKIWISLAAAEAVFLLVALFKLT
jgi:hypothetical protein